MTEKRCKFKEGKWNCGSYAFNLCKENIDQGDRCDHHYWQDRALKAEAMTQLGPDDFFEEESLGEVVGFISDSNYIVVLVNEGMQVDLNDQVFLEGKKQQQLVEPTGNEWFEWWRVSAIADSTEAEIDFSDFFIIAQAVIDKLKETNK